MIDLKKLRENKADYEAGFKKKRADIDVDKVLELDEKHRKLIVEVEGKKAEKNEVISAGYRDLGLFYCSPWPCQHTYLG